MESTAYDVHMQVCALQSDQSSQTKSNPAPCDKKSCQNARLSFSHMDMKTSEHKTKLNRGLGMKLTRR